MIRLREETAAGSTPKAWRMEGRKAERGEAYVLPTTAEAHRCFTEGWNGAHSEREKERRRQAASAR